MCLAQGEGVGDGDHAGENAHDDAADVGVLLLFLLENLIDEAVRYEVSGILRLVAKAENGFVALAAIAGFWLCQFFVFPG